MVEPQNDERNEELQDEAPSSAKIQIEIPEDVAPAKTSSESDLMDQIQDAEGRVLRAQAELENFRRRTRREMDESLKYANQPLLADLLPVIDNVYRAVSAASNDSEAKSLLEGFLMVAQQLLDALSKHGCSRMDALGEPFDPNLHEAMLQQPSDEYESGNVMQVVQEGYTLHDRVLRPAHVIISTGPAESE